MLIQLTHVPSANQSSPILIGVNQILSVEAGPRGSTVLLPLGKVYHVAESVDEVADACDACAMGPAGDTARQKAAEKRRAAREKRQAEEKQREAALEAQLRQKLDVERQALAQRTEREKTAIDARARVEMEQAKARLQTSGLAVKPANYVPPILSSGESPTPDNAPMMSSDPAMRAGNEEVPRRDSVVEKGPREEGQDPAAEDAQKQRERLAADAARQGANEGRAPQAQPPVPAIKPGKK
jgi:hypothetical protein